MDSAASSSSSHSLITTNTKTKSNISFPAKSDPNSSPNTTFVETDPSNFKTIVQKLTGADQQTLLSSRYQGKPTSGENGITHRRYPFKLHERRLQSGRNLEIKLQNGVGSTPGSGMERVPFLGFVGETAVMVSPVSPLEMILARGSPITPRSPSEEEDRVIAEKGFYLHPSPLNTPRRGSEPPELLPLFPLSSPRDDDSRTNQ